MDTGDHEVENLLLEWWTWAHTGTGKPGGYWCPLGDRQGVSPVVTEEEALKVEREICALSRRWPDEHAALLAFLQCGGNQTETARRLRCNVATARLYVQRAEAWLDARLA